MRNHTKLCSSLQLDGGGLDIQSSVELSNIEDFFRFFFLDFILYELVVFRFHSQLSIFPIHRFQLSFSHDIVNVSFSNSRLIYLFFIFLVVSNGVSFSEISFLTYSRFLVREDLIPICCHQDSSQETKFFNIENIYWFLLGGIVVLSGYSKRFWYFLHFINADNLGNQRKIFF